MVFASTVSGSCALTIVERIDEGLHELALRARTGFLPLLRRALAIVVVFRGETQVAIALLLELAIRAGCHRCALTAIAICAVGSVVVRRRGAIWLIDIIPHEFHPFE